VGPEAEFTNDAERVITNLYFLDRFGLPPDVTERQEESMMADIMLADRELNYQKWCIRHDLEVEDYEELFATLNAPGIYKLLGKSPDG